MPSARFRAMPAWVMLGAVVRIGVATAKGLALGLGRPLVGLRTSEVIARALSAAPQASVTDAHVRESLLLHVTALGDTDVDMDAATAAGDGAAAAPPTATAGHSKAAPEVEALGHVINAQGMRPKADKVIHHLVVGRPERLGRLAFRRMRIVLLGRAVLVVMPAVFVQIVVRGNLALRMQDLITRFVRMMPTTPQQGMQGQGDGDEVRNERAHKKFRADQFRATSSLSAVTSMQG